MTFLKGQKLIAALDAPKFSGFQGRNCQVGSQQLIDRFDG